MTETKKNCCCCCCDEDQIPAGELDLSNLFPTPGSRHRRKRLGIGEGSGSGKTSGKGQKGQRARSGASRKKGFEGGQMPIQRRLPKRGFTSRQRIRGENVYDIVSLKRVVELGLGQKVGMEDLVLNGLASPNSRVKLLGGFEPTSPLYISVHAASASAVAAIEKAGGKVEIIGCN